MNKGLKNNIIIILIQILILIQIIAIILLVIVLGLAIRGAPSGFYREVIEDDQYTILMYNSRFEQYAGNQTGSNVKSLLTAVIKNNSETLEDRKIDIVIGEEGINVPNSITDTVAIADILARIRLTSKYIVEITKYGNDSNRLVSEITITEKFIPEITE